MTNECNYDASKQDIEGKLIYVTEAYITLDSKEEVGTINLSWNAQRKLLILLIG